MKIMSLSFYLLLLLPAALVQAGEGKTLTWAEVVAKAGNHPALQVARESLAVAGAEVDLQGQYPNPELGVSAGVARAKEGNESAPIWGVELEVPIHSPGAFINHKRAARAEQEALGHEVDAVRLESMMQLRALYLRVGLAEERILVLGESQKQLDRIIEVAKVRVEKGVARPQELIRLEIEQEKLRVELLGAKDTALLVQHKLRLWLGLRSGGELTVEATLDELPGTPDLEASVARAKESHPSLMAAAQREKGAASLVRAQKKARFPEMAIGGFYESELDANNMGAMLNLTLPVWNWNAGGVAKAKAEELRTKNQTQLVAIELESFVREAHFAAKQARVRAEAYKNVIVPKEKSAVEALEQMYKVGEVGVMEILYSRQSGLDTELEMLEALYEAHFAYSQLAMVIGDGDVTK